MAYNICMYGYENLINDLKTIKNARIFTIGKSYFNRNIYAVIVGCGVPKVLIHGAIHGREHITARLVANLAKNHTGKAICFVPMVNPDGVELAVNGLKSAPVVVHKYLTKVNGSQNFALWKANGRAVDLNVNFDADWGRGKLNITKPASENYIGAYPESEKETQVLINLTKHYKFNVSISYHCKGNVIYYGFNHLNPYQMKALKISKTIKYPLLTSLGSAGGYKDWFILNNYGLGLTIEVGNDKLKHPLCENTFDEIWRHNKNITKSLVDISEEIWTKNL